MLWEVALLLGTAMAEVNDQSPAVVQDAETGRLWQIKTVEVEHGDHGDTVWIKVEEY